MNDRSDFAIKLKRDLDRLVIGQAEYKKSIAIHATELVFDGKTSPILVMGPTGSGKTHTIRALEKSNLLKTKGFTVYTCDSTNLSATGYAGGDFATVMKEYRKMCVRDGNLDYRGIIFVDEFDKICRKSFSSEGENTNYAVQATILTALEPSTTIFGYDTSKIMFVLAGAFAEFYEELDNKNKKMSFGFGQEDAILGITSLPKDIRIREELIKYGCVRELLGRISDLVEISKLDASQLLALLSHPKRGYIVALKKSYSEYGIELDFKEEMLNLIIERIEVADLGARGIKTVVNSLLSTTLFDAIENNAERVIVHSGMFDGERAIFICDGKTKAS